MPRKKKGPGDPDVVAQVASVAGTELSDLEKLKAQIADLEAKLAIEKKARGAAEQAALEAAESQANGLMQQTEVMEVPTGKKVKVQVGNGYETVGYKDDGRPILRPKFKTEERPTFFYKINLPPVGGIGLTTNGMPLYHGTVYEFDIDTLRDVKSRVYAVWKHDADIHGSDENVYRKPQPKQMSMKTGRVVRL